jgi:hypothetical protein
LQDAGAIILSVATNKENCEGAATNFRKNNAYIGTGENEVGFRNP